MIPQSDPNQGGNGEECSVVNLNQHNNDCQEVRNFAEQRIRQEAAQQHEQALCLFLDERSSLPGSGDYLLDPCSDMGPIEPASVSQDLPSMLRLYQPLPPSSEDPMQRFCTLNTADEPMPLVAKDAMNQMGIAVGSLETTESRMDAAHDAAELELDDEDDEQHSEAYAPAVYRRAAGRFGTRVKRDVQQRKRRNSRNNGNGNGENSHKRRKAD